MPASHGNPPPGGWASACPAGVGEAGGEAARRNQVAVRFADAFCVAVSFADSLSDVLAAEDA